MKILRHRRVRGSLPVAWCLLLTRSSPTMTTTGPLYHGLSVVEYLNKSLVSAGCPDFTQIGGRVPARNSLAQIETSDGLATAGLYLATGICGCHSFQWDGQQGGADGRCWYQNHAAGR